MMEYITREKARDSKPETLYSTTRNHQVIRTLPQTETFQVTETQITNEDQFESSLDDQQEVGSNQIEFDVDLIPQNQQGLQEDYFIVQPVNLGNIKHVQPVQFSQQNAEVLLRNSYKPLIDFQSVQQYPVNDDKAKEQDELVSPLDISEWVPYGGEIIEREDKNLIEEKIGVDHEIRYVWNDYEPVLSQQVIAKFKSFQLIKSQIELPEGMLHEDCEREESRDKLKLEPIEGTDLLVDKNSLLFEQSFLKTQPPTNLHVTPADSLKRFQSIVYYKISGTFKTKLDVSNSSIYRRYNDFKSLHTLLSNQFYFRVLPHLPDKGIAYKIKASPEMIKKRAQGLQIYLNKLVLIPEVLSFEPFEKFLLDQEGFNLLWKRTEIKKMVQSEGFFKNAEQKLVGLWRFIAQKDDVVDYGYYCTFAKEIDGLFIFVKNIYENYQKIDENMRNIYHGMISLADIGIKLRPKKPIDLFSASELMGLSIYHLKPNVNRRYLITSLITVFERIYVDIIACKEALARKDRIYFENQRLLDEIVNKEPNESQKAKIELMRSRIELLEGKFKPDLKTHIQYIKSNLDLIFREGIEHVFVDLFEID